MKEVHSAEGSSVPAFLTKLWRLVEDSEYDDIICWNQTGLSFIIHNQTQFAQELLPLYFKHNNMASFIRQLNMYGFKKMINIEQGGLRSKKDSIAFFHQFFVKGQELLLEFIKRKVSASRPANAAEEVSIKSGTVNELLSDVQNIRAKQEGVDSLLSNMKRENEALWREVAFLRQKHLKQQQIVEKLIQFLVTLVQPSGVNLNVVKRKLPLLLYNSNNSNTGNSGGSNLPDSSKNVQRLARQISSTAGSSKSIPTSGPVIHEMTDSLDQPISSPLNVVSDTPEVSGITTDPDPANDLGSMIDVTEFINIAPEFSDTVPSNVESPLSIPQPSTNSPMVNSPLEDELFEPMSMLNPIDSSSIGSLEPNKNLPDASETPTVEDVEINNLIGLAGNVLADSLTTPDISYNPLELSLNLKTDLEAKQIKKPNNQVEETTKNQSDDSEMMQLALNEPNGPFSPLGYRSGTVTSSDRGHLSDHLEGIESELDWLQDQLSGNSLNLDISNLLGLFGSDDTVPGNNLPMDARKCSNGEVTGTEIVQYLPNLPEFVFIEEENSNQAQPSSTVSGASDLNLESPNLISTSVEDSSLELDDALAQILGSPISNQTKKNSSPPSPFKKQQKRKNLEATIDRVKRKPI